MNDVFSDLRNIKDAGDAEDHVHVVLRTESGITADIVVSTAMAQAAAPRWMLCGSRGALVSDGETSKLRFYDGHAVPPLSVLDTAAPDRKYQSETLPWQEKELTIGEPPVPKFHRNVLDVLTGKAEPIVTPESVAEVVRVTEMLHNAAR